MKPITLLITLFIFGVTTAQNSIDKTKVPVMTLGTFHFSYPNLDVIKTEKKDQVDLRSPKRQAEVEALVQQLKAFRPTRIVIEAPVADQPRIDSQYRAYREGKFSLPVGEEYQVGFRLAKLLGLERVYCVDTWGNIDYFMTTSEKGEMDYREERRLQMERYEAFTDSLVKAGALERQKLQAKAPGSYQTLSQILATMNSSERLKKDHSAYFGARFRFEAEPYDYTGTDWLALSWYSRNLRIFRNVLRIPSDPTDRILLIYGAGHAYLLNQLFDESLTHRAVSPLPYLK